MTVTVTNNYNLYRFLVYSLDAVKEIKTYLKNWAEYYQYIYVIKPHLDWTEIQISATQSNWDEIKNDIDYILEKEEQDTMYQDIVDEYC